MLDTMASGERGSLDTELAVSAEVATKQTSSACNSLDTAGISAY